MKQVNQFGETSTQGISDTAIVFST